MKLNDATLRALPLTEAGQRDYSDDLVRGLSIRVGKQTKTFMVLIRSGANRSRVKLGTYPECSLSRARQLARDKLAAARLAKDELPSITVAEALDTFYRIRGAEQRQSTRIRCQYLLAWLWPFSTADRSSTAGHSSGTLFRMPLSMAAR